MHKTKTCLDFICFIICVWGQFLPYKAEFVSILETLRFQYRNKEFLI